MLFFRDPLRADSGSSNEQNLLRLCDMHSVPIATNIATAEVLLRGMDQGDLDYREGMHPPGDRASGRSPAAPCAEDCLTFFVYRGNVKQRRRSFSGLQRRCIFMQFSVHFPGSGIIPDRPSA